MCKLAGSPRPGLAPRRLAAKCWFAQVATLALHRGAVQAVKLPFGNACFWPAVPVRGWRRQLPSGQVLTESPFIMSTSSTSRTEVVTQGFRWIPFSASIQLQLRPLSY